MVINIKHKTLNLQELTVLRKEIYFNYHNMV